MNSIIEYILIFIGAAIPWIEAIIVIPIGIIRGLHPVAVTIVAFCGNLLTILLVVFFYEKMEEWMRKRREKKGTNNDITKKRFARAQRIWDKYGMPGLSLIGPLLIGTHFTIFMTLALSSSKKASTWWMIISLLIWCLIAAIGFYYGLNLVSILRG